MPQKKNVTQHQHTFLSKNNNRNMSRQVLLKKEAITYIEQHKRLFDIDTPKLDELWYIERFATYPNVNNGKEVVEIKRGNRWMRLPADLVEILPPNGCNGQCDGCHDFMCESREEETVIGTGAEDTDEQYMKALGTERFIKDFKRLIYYDSNGKVIEDQDAEKLGLSVPAYMSVNEAAYDCAYKLSNDWEKEVPTWKDVQNAYKLGVADCYKKINDVDLLPYYDL